MLLGVVGETDGGGKKQKFVEHVAGGEWQILAEGYMLRSCNEV